MTIFSNRTTKKNLKPVPETYREMSLHCTAVVFNVITFKGCIQVIAPSHYYNQTYRKNRYPENILTFQS